MRSVSVKISARMLILSAAAMVVALVLSGRNCQAQDEPLYERQPFDRIILKQGGPQGVLDVRTLTLPNRQVPNPFPTGTLRIRLTDPLKANVEYEVPWSDIARIELYETMLMTEGQKLVKAGKYDDAYDYFAQLAARFPNTAGLEEAIDGYLQGNAMAAFSANEYDRALAILGALHDREASKLDISAAVDNVAGKIIEQQLRNKNYKSARQTLEIVTRSFSDLRLTIVPGWRTRFQQEAAKQMREAQTAFAARDFKRARAAIDQAVGVWPEIAGSAELQREIQSAHPVISIGVYETAPVDGLVRIDSWPHRRAGELLTPRLSQLIDYSPEGGVYRSPAGTIDIDETGLAATITLAASTPAQRRQLPVATAALARELARAAMGDVPGASPALGELVADVAIEYPDRVRLALRQPYVRPEALLRLPLPAEVVALMNNRSFQVIEVDETHTAFGLTRPSQAEGGMAEIHEVLMKDEDQATTQLSDGRIDVIDHIPPWQAQQLAKVPGITVEAYKLPTVHVLVPVSSNALLARREFRRALCYGIDREGIVKRVLLGEREVPGYIVVSGPFAGREAGSEVVPYAYNSAIKPRDFDPRLASMLMTVAWSAAQPKPAKPKEGEAPKEPPPLPPLPKLVLAHSRDPLARLACQAIAAQLKPLGLELKLVEMTAEQLVDPKIEGVDLRYAELSAWEPVADARDLLGANGTLPKTTDFMVLALDKLDRAQNWNEVRVEMFNIHQNAAGDLPVVPLWQTRNHFARRARLEGVAPSTVTLYQDVAAWRLNFERDAR